MTRASSFGGLILAAGESSRMGRDKALLPWKGRTLLEGHIRALQFETDFVLVVAGKNAAALEPVIDAAGAFLVINPAPERGQFSSLQVGLQEVMNRGRDAAIVALVDRPAAQPETMAALRLYYMQSPPGVWMVIPQQGERHGHPIVLGREMITAFLSAPPTSNAREVEHSHQEHIAYLAVDDPHIVENLNTMADYQRIAELR